MMAWIVGLALLCVLAVPIALLAERRVRQAKTRALLAVKSARGIVAEEYVRIGEFDQWIGIRGEDRDNPVLLVLHGGPGSSYSIFTPHLRAWEKHFTIVQWDQRGCGKSFARAGKLGSCPITFEQLTRDAAEVAQHVRTRLGKERIFLLASSIGSIIGAKLARRRPDLLYAYIGTDQNVGMKRDREESHRELLARLSGLGLSKGVRVLTRIGSDPARWSVKDFEAVARWTMRSDTRGYARTMKLLKDAVWYAPQWTLGDIRSFVAGMRFSLGELLPEIARYDAWEDGCNFDVPFFVFQGEVDVLTTPALAQAFFRDVTAPVKRFVLISDAGHFAAFIEPEEFLRQLLRDVRPLADRSRPAAAGNSSIISWAPGSLAGSSPPPESHGRARAEFVRESRDRERNAC